MHGAKSIAAGGQGLAPRWMRRGRDVLTRGEANALLDGALLVAGVVAVFDNALVHWVLGWHRLVEGWPGTIYAELALVAIGAAMLGAALVRLRRRARRREPTATDQRP